ncbi:MAG: acyl-CoA desaturase [Bacteroidota bacterium]
MKYTSLQFAKSQTEFFATVSQRVNNYFKSNKIERTANMNMVVKTLVMFFLYFAPYTLVLTQVVTGGWGFFLTAVIMGIGVSGIGLSIMHDANHGSYSKKAWVNNLLGFSLNLVGANAFNWKVQHNVLHHTYTNVHEVDEDISPRGVLRMAPTEPWKPMHQFQHLYAWFFYGLLTIVWIGFKDYGRLLRYGRDGLVAKQKTTLAKEWAVLIVTKLFYIFYLFVLPVLLVPAISWWMPIVGFLIMHYIAGFILAIIFQPAHVIDGTEYPLPDENGNLENNWAIHQLHTTTNFGRKHRLFSWFVGGLNYQVEHHLFPNVCHVHYRAIAPIVENTAKEFGLPYKSKETFLEAIVAHAKIMRELGKKPVFKPALKPVPVPVPVSA